MVLGLFWEWKEFEGVRSCKDIRRGAKLLKRVNEVKIDSKCSMQFPSNITPKATYDTFSQTDF
jgi:hypothetical protein